MSSIIITIFHGLGRRSTHKRYIMKERLLSLDVFRGMTICFMIIVNNPGSWGKIYTPLKHADWHGCTPTDLVFPFFVLIVGFSMVFSFAKLGGKPKGRVAVKILKRAFLIFLVGLLLNWFPFFHKHISDLRIMGVLQKIALSYGGAAFIILYARKEWLPFLTGILLLGYWALLFYGGGELPYGPKENLVRAVDLAILGPSHMYSGFGLPFDPEGIVGCIPSIGTVIIGYIAGSRILKLESKDNLIFEYTIAGIALVSIGYLWGLQFPINKPLWTSSYVLYTAGLGILLIAILIYIIDVLKWDKWTMPFRVFGLNPLFSFVLSGVVVKIFIYILKINGRSINNIAYQDFFQPLFGDYLGSFLYAISFMIFIWIFAYFLYRKRIIVKL